MSNGPQKVADSIFVNPPPERLLNNAKKERQGKGGGKEGRPAEMGGRGGEKSETKTWERGSALAIAILLHRSTDQTFRIPKATTF